MVHVFPMLDDVGFSVFDAVMTALECLPNATGIANARRGQRNDWLRMPFLFSLFWVSVNFDSSDPRDRVYALLGLATARKYRDALRPDYKIKIEDLYVKVAARQMLFTEENLHFLHNRWRASATGAPSACRRGFLTGPRHQGL